MLIVDLRDVYFQHNPFHFHIRNGVTVFEESRRANWEKLGGYSKRLKITYPDYYRAIKSYYNINGGVIYFSINEGLLFLESFYEFMNKTDEKLPNDQIVINILVYIIERNFTIFIYPNLLGPVKTMAHERGEIECSFPKQIKIYKETSIFINEKNRLVNIGGIEPLIIHSNWIFNDNSIIKKQRNQYI